MRDFEIIAENSLWLMFSADLAIQNGKTRAAMDRQ